MSKPLQVRTNALHDGAAASFTVSVYEAQAPTHVVLFAAGAGGQPERYATLLATLAAAGCRVVAPHFERLVPPAVSEADLVLRARRLSLALDAFALPGLPVAGVGHSIGGTTLLSLVGAQLWLAPGRRVPVAPDGRLTRLVVLAPPTGYFRAPGALEAVRVPILAWVGTEDSITPPDQTQCLAQAMQAFNAVEVRVTEGAGHFSFMDLLPPNATEPLPNKDIFLHEFSRDVSHFVLS